MRRHEFPIKTVFGPVHAIAATATGGFQGWRRLAGGGAPTQATILAGGFGIGVVGTRGAAAGRTGGYEALVVPERANAELEG